MTTIASSTVSCVNCNKSSEQNVIFSTNTMGPPDLDLRPAEMARSTLRYQVQECPHCRYVATNLSERQGDLGVMTTPEYKMAFKSGSLPPLARTFMARGLLLDPVDPNAAAQAYLRAAWACDDKPAAKLAADFRCTAADRFLKLLPVENTQESVTRGTVFVDVFRRAGRFEEAMNLCKSLLELDEGKGDIAKVLNFQLQLLAARDQCCYEVR